MALDIFHVLNALLRYHIFCFKVFIVGTDNASMHSCTGGCQFITFWTADHEMMLMLGEFNVIHRKRSLKWVSIFVSVHLGWAFLSAPADFLVLDITETKP